MLEPQSSLQLLPPPQHAGKVVITVPSKSDNSQIRVINPILLGMGLVLLWYIGSGVVSAVQKLTAVLEAGLVRGAG